MRLKQSRAVFTSSDRAVCREVEEIALSEMDKEIEALVKLGLAQGWQVDPIAGGKLGWKGPNGEGPVFTPLRVVGRGKNNVMAQLQRAGLDISSLKKPRKQHSTALEMPGPILADLAEEHGAPRIASKVRELVTLPEGGYDQLMSDYLSEVAGALTAFINAGNLLPADRDDPRLVEAETLYLKAEERVTELMEKVNELNAKIEGLREDRDKLSRERDDCKVKEAAALERAVTAENKLAILRSALKED